MTKKITLDQINKAALDLGIEPAALRAVIEIECRGDGFDANGLPVILYERHIFYRLLRSINWITKSNEWAKAYPDLCNPSSGGYGKLSAQHDKLDRAAKLNRDVALQSCSWGVGQVMGFHWKALGYASIQEFVNLMYRDEAAQLDAMCRFIKVNKLVGALQRHDWAAFARGYNGGDYKRNNYDTRLATAYAKFKK